MSNFYEQLCQTFIRPARQVYNAYDLGQPVRQNGRRIDFHVHNNRQQKVLCSFYSSTLNPLAPCIVYLHSLNGSRLESLPFVAQVLAKGFNFCSFDFAGTGLSQGQYVSLGYHQRHDIKAVLNQICSKFNIKHFYLWGRSMGAAAAIKYMSMINNSPKKTKKVQNDYHIDGLVLDSPFQSLTQLTIQIAKQKIAMPELFIKAILIMIESSIEQKAAFKITDMELLPDIKYIKCPVLLLTSKDDKLVLSKHSEKIYDAISHKDREIMFIRGEHNSTREPQTIAYIIEFICKDAQKKRCLLNGKASTIKSSKLINYKMNHLTASTAVGSKSFKKLTNISMEGVRFDTTGDQQAICSKLEDDFDNKQKVKFAIQKDYKKALHLYSPKVHNVLQKKSQLIEQSNVAKNINFKTPTDSFIDKKDRIININQNKINFDQNFQYHTEKKIYNNGKNEKTNIQLNKSPIKIPPKFHLQNQHQNKEKTSKISMTPQTKITQSENNKYLLKQSLIKSESRDKNHIEMKKHAAEETNHKIYSSIEINHFNIIGDKIKKKKKKGEGKDLSPKPNASQDNRIPTISLQRKSQLAAKAQPQFMKIRLQNENLWRNQNN